MLVKGAWLAMHAANVLPAPALQCSPLLQAPRMPAANQALRDGTQGAELRRHHVACWDLLCSAACCAGVHVRWMLSAWMPGMNSFRASCTCAGSKRRPQADSMVQLTCMTEGCHRVAVLRASQATQPTSWPRKPAACMHRGHRCSQHAPPLLLSTAAVDLCPVCILLPFGAAR
jgi:hypothetical protein